MLEESLGARILTMDTPLLPYASSRIRAWCREGQSVRYYVPEAVRTYIMDHGLYGSRPNRGGV